MVPRPVVAHPPAAAAAFSIMSLSSVTPRSPTMIVPLSCIVGVAFTIPEVGPRLADNTPEGGLSLAEASLELRRRLKGPWGVVAFVDAGTIGGAQFPSFRELSVGAGLGVRYNLGFGPIRVDVATPVTGRHGQAPFQLYVSIGQSF